MRLIQSNLSHCKILRGSFDKFIIIVKRIQEFPQVPHTFFIFLTELLSVELNSDKNVVFNDFMQIN